MSHSLHRDIQIDREQRFTMIAAVSHASRRPRHSGDRSIKLLKVTIANIDGPFEWLFDSDDRRVCVRRALDDLIANHGFFKDNLILTQFPSDFTPDENVYGILFLPGEEDDLDPVELSLDRDYDGNAPDSENSIPWDIVLDSENTYWITVEEYTTGTVYGPRTMLPK